MSPSKQDRIPGAAASHPEYALQPASFCEKNIFLSSKTHDIYGNVSTCFSAVSREV
jgi:hypothetical protein